MEYEPQRYIVLLHQEEFNRLAGRTVYYEIIVDLEDLEGNRAEVVVDGEEVFGRIFDQFVVRVTLCGATSTIL